MGSGDGRRLKGKGETDITKGITDGITDGIQKSIEDGCWKLPFETNIKVYGEDISIEDQYKLLKFAEKNYEIYGAQLVMGVLWYMIDDLKKDPRLQFRNVSPMGYSLLKKAMKEQGTLEEPTLDNLVMAADSMNTIVNQKLESRSSQ